MIWREFEAEAPDLARRGRERFAKTGVALLATLRADGSPRINPVEPYFVEDHVLLGLMRRSKKALDLVRDPRFGLHSSVSDPNGADGEFKLYGRARDVKDPDLWAAAREAWWVSRPREHSRVFSLDIESAAFVAWDVESGEMTVTRWGDCILDTG